MIKNTLNGFSNQEHRLGEDQMVIVLTDAYEKTMETIVGQEPDLKALATQVLAWITCARRPLSILELQHALAVRPSSEEFDDEYLPDIEMMMSACAGLVTTDEKSGIIRLVHHTTHEYFEKTQAHWFPEAHLTITRVCTTYLSYPTFAGGHCKTSEELNQRLDSNPFYGYAASNWGHHARFTSLCDDVHSFLRKRGHVEASGQVIQSAHKDFPQQAHAPRGMTGFHLASHFGLTDAFDHINEYDVGSRDCCNRTPLSWAVEMGREDIVSIFLKKGADIELRDESRVTNLLYLAASSGNEATVRLLLEGGAYIEARNQLGQTPLLEAIKHSGISAPELLIKLGANVEAKDQYGQNCLFYAVTRIPFIYLLLKAGANIEAQNNAGWTPLLRAVGMGLLIEPTIQILLEEGANIEARTMYTNWTPLWIAVKNDNIAVAQILLEERANTEAKDGITGLTPLLWAVQNRSWPSNVVPLLLEWGANIEARDPHGRTSFWMAVHKGKRRWVSLLLQEGADIEAQSNSSWTPLWIAVKDKNIAMVQLLLEKGANIEAKDKHTNQTPLWVAVKDNSEGMVKVLLERGANIEAKDGDSGWTPLLWAVWNGSRPIVQLLLEEGANIEATQNHAGWTPLFVAVYEESEDIVKLLLERGADTEVTDQCDGSTLLSEAERGSKAILQLILERHTDRSWLAGRNSCKFIVV